MQRTLIAALAVALFAGTSYAATVVVPVGNGSFETEGPHVEGPANWYTLPSPGDWAFTNVNPYQILDMSVSNNHFPSGAADGNNGLNLATAGNLTQDLSYAITTGDIITLTFDVGNSNNQTDPPGDPTVRFTLDASTVYTEVVDNDATNDAWLEKTVQWTATSSGNLGIGFSGPTGTWIDDVNVEVTLIPAPAVLPAGLMLLGMVARRERSRTALQRRKD